MVGFHMQALIKLVIRNSNRGYCLWIFLDDDGEYLKLLTPKFVFSLRYPRLIGGPHIIFLNTTDFEAKHLIPKHLRFTTKEPVTYPA